MPPEAWILAFFITLVILVLGDRGEAKKKKKIIDGFLHNKELPEPRRRAELAAYLGNKGCQIVAQDAGMLQVKEKSPFSFILFIILCCIYVLPGVLYLIWYFTQKQKLHTFVLDF